MLRRKLLIYANIALFFVVIWFAIPLIQRWRRAHTPPPQPVYHRTAQTDYVDPAKGAQIIQFYASPHVIWQGDHTLLCYGVAQVKSVKIEPTAGDAWPTFNRCLDVAPSKTTKYTLTATGAGGKQLQQTTTIYVAERSRTATQKAK